MERRELRDGSSIPCMGFGCYNAFGEEIHRAVECALEVGYRYIDSAEMYGNEEDVGKAIGSCTVDRGELFLLSKAWPSSYDDLEAALTRSLHNLQAEYLDAYLLHWPGRDESRRLKAYEQLLRLKERGLIRTAAVSNFLPDQLDRLREEFGAYPPLIEYEVHPSYQQRELVQSARERGMAVIAYSPINRTADLSSGTVREMAARKQKTPAQVVLRWHLQRGLIPIPKSSNPERIRENLSIFDFSLSQKELEAIDALECGNRSGQDPRIFPEE